MNIAKGPSVNQLIDFRGGRLNQVSAISVKLHKLHVKIILRRGVGVKKTKKRIS
jgi:hypothetical protein